jgi:FixJ family two-component response regulator
MSATQSAGDPHTTNAAPGYARMTGADGPAPDGLGEPVEHSQAGDRGDGHVEVTNEAIVYVVDDDESICRALARLFRSVGLASETFASAKAFLEHPASVRPACLILDIRLPGPSGLDLQTALSQAGRDVPIVFITGHGDVSSSVRAMKGGAIDFLQKPFNDQELLDCVHRALARSRERLAAVAERRELESRLETLTPREREVMLQVVTGKLNKQIAADLGIAEKTVKVHRGRVMQKMRANSVAELVRIVENLGLT